MKLRNIHLENQALNAFVYTPFYHDVTHSSHAMSTYGSTASTASQFTGSSGSGGGFSGGGGGGGGGYYGSAKKSSKKSGRKSGSGSKKTSATTKGNNIPGDQSTSRILVNPKTGKETKNRISGMVK